MDFHDFARFVGKIGVHLIPPSSCAQASAQVMAHTGLWWGAGIGMALPWWSFRRYNYQSAARRGDVWDVLQTRQSSHILEDAATFLVDFRAF